MSSLRFAATGSLSALPADQRKALIDRRPADAIAEANANDVRESVARIVGAVRTQGDAVLRELAQSLDGVTLESLEVPRATWLRAVDRIDRPVRKALERMAANIASVHAAFLPTASRIVTDDGVIIGRRPDPLDRAGVYAPGGRASYPSSLLMGAVPARVAGVREVVVCSPPQASGSPADVLLAAAAIAEVDRVFALGGAGAIAAMAYGTESVPRVDRVVGPGNAYVAEAKLQVVSAVAIDAPAGPSELLVLADNTANVQAVAQEMLAQAEHDPDAAVVLVTTDAAVADAVTATLRARVIEEPRQAIITKALEARGAVLVAANDRDALEFASEYAAEHVLLAVADPGTWLPRVRNAGTVFLGEASSVAFGDYLTGANHVLPTGGLARAYSGLSTLDFVRWTTYQEIDRSAAARLSADTGTLATAEGLPAHATAARQWSS